MNLLTPIEEIPRIGPQYQKRLKRMGIKNIRDLLFHFPHRYEDFSNIIPTSQADAGGPFCFQGKILEIRNLRTFRRKMIITQATLGDESGKIKVIWFNQPYLINTLKKDEFVCLAGKVTKKNSSKYLSNPAYEKISPPTTFREDDSNQINALKSGGGLTHTGRLIPVYPETEGVSSKWLRFIIKPLLTKFGDKIPDSLPAKIIKENNFFPIEKALWQIHFPDSLLKAEEAKRRFSFEEIFIISLFVLRERMKLMKEKAMAMPINIELIKKFTEGLPFNLTDDQKKSAWQTLKDMEKNRPMNRLLEGDVGSGKTMVAMIAALNAVKAGYQMVFMAPTEILAKQHFKTFSQFLNPPPLFRKKLPLDELKQKWWGVNIGLITGKESYFKSKKIPRKELLEKTRNGETDILIGTHALIQPPTTFRKNNLNQIKSIKSGGGVKFKNLALVIIDEQHRFGVEQRAKLLQNANFKLQNVKIPHFLSMTATPIPRTLALTIYGDLDISLIQELPKGRKKIITKVIPPKERKESYDFIRDQIKEGRQAFVICPRIEPAFASPKPERAEAGFVDATARQSPLLDERVFSWLDVKAVKKEFEKLSKEIFPDLKVGQLHGKMKTEEKEEVMKKFQEDKIDILVSTSVVEVGIDIPNASIMMIEGAERFGLAQLHQFRGRVGRSVFQSYCLLFTEMYSKTINARLRALVSCENGFELAEKDLAIRGPGDFSGARQWGIPDLVMDSLRDVLKVEKIREEAKEILAADPQLKKYPLLRKRIEEFKKKIHLE